MSTKSITVYQAMVDLKLMKKQLETMMSELNSVLSSSTNPFMKDNVIMKIPFVAIKTIGGTELGSTSVEDLEKTLQSNFDKYNHLIMNIEAYSAAIAQSNANTKIKVAGVEYTVAEAIKRKELAINRANFLSLVKKQASLAYYSINKKNAEIEKNWLEQLKTLNKEGEIQLSEEFIEKQKDEFYDNNTYEIVDPMGHVATIDSRIDEHNAFINEVDTVLTTSNVQTIIDIVLED